MRYKTSVIKTLLHRGHHVSSNSDTFQTEVQRVRQLLTGNSFPMNLFIKLIDKFIASRETARVPVPETSDAINFWFQNQMTSIHKVEERKFSHIVDRYVKLFSVEVKIKRTIHYKTKRLFNRFIKNKTVVMRTPSRSIM